MVTLSSRRPRRHRHHGHPPRRLLRLPLSLDLHLHHRPALVEGGHQWLPTIGNLLGRGILDVFRACSMVRQYPSANAGIPNVLAGRTVRAGVRPKEG